MKSRNVFIAVVFVVSLVIFASCSLLSGPGTGTLVLSFSPQLVSQTIEPDLNMQVTSYTVEGDGPGSATFSETGVTGPTFVKASLVPGEWVLTVHAVNTDGDVIGAGTSTVTVSAGELLNVTVEVVPLPGDGTLSLLVSWPSGVLTDPVLEATLVPSGETLDPLIHTIDFVPGTDSASYLDGALAGGYYELTLRLLDSGSDPVWGTVEAVRILAGQESAATFALVKEVNRGGLGVLIDEQLNNPFDVSLDLAAGSVVTEGDSLVVTATAAASVDTWMWYLQGAPLASSGNSVSLSGLDVGYYNLSVVAISGSIMSSTSVAFQVAPAGSTATTGYLDLSASYIGEGPFDSGSLLLLEVYDYDWVIAHISESTPYVTVVELSSNTRDIAPALREVPAGDYVVAAFVAFVDDGTITNENLNAKTDILQVYTNEGIADPLESMRVIVAPGGTTPVHIDVHDQPSGFDYDFTYTGSAYTISASSPVLALLYNGDLVSTVPSSLAGLDPASFDQFATFTSNTGTFSSTDFGHYGSWTPVLVFDTNGNGFDSSDPFVIYWTMVEFDHGGTWSISDTVDDSRIVVP